MKGLMLHCGANQCDRADVANVSTPDATDTWHPIPHLNLLEQVEGFIDNFGFEVVNQAHGLWKETLRYFGLLELSPKGSELKSSEYNLVAGLRNSHDKSFPASLALGFNVFVCDNLAFSGEVVIGRRHTKHIMRDLPNLVNKAIGQLFAMRQNQDKRIDAYKEHLLTDIQVNDLLIRSFDQKVIGATRIPKVLEQWRQPAHEEFAERNNVWRLLNGYTEVMKGTNLMELPKRTQALHALLDMECGLELEAPTVDGRVVHND